MLRFYLARADYKTAIEKVGVHGGTVFKKTGASGDDGVFGKFIDKDL